MTAPLQKDDFQEDKLQLHAVKRITKTLLTLMQTCCLEVLIKIPQNQAETVHASATVLIKLLDTWYRILHLLLADIRTNTLFRIFIHQRILITCLT